MSYEPTIWKKGDKVTSTKLNKIENGIQGNDEEITSIKENLTDKAPVITETASGSIASFSDGADNLLLKSLVVNINPVQDLHGQESPYPAGVGRTFLTVLFCKDIGPTQTAHGQVTQNGLRPKRFRANRQRIIRQAQTTDRHGGKASCITTTTGTIYRPKI